MKRMWQWIRSFFVSPEEPYDQFRPKDRMIYTYWSGSQTVRADPLALYKKMMDVGPSLAIDMKVANSASKDAGKAHDELVEKIRSIFSVAPLDKGGLTELETVELLDHFLTYVGMVKKNSSSYPTSPTGTSEPSASTSAEGPPTTSSADCGSTASGPSTAEPTPSLQPSASPSA